ncbi:MAG: M50 family metallopeptidase [Thermoanaerobaculia bacterium]
MPCPKCGFENDDRAIECARCGVILAKAMRVDVPLRDPYVIEHERVEDGRIGPPEIKILGFGLAAAIFVYWIPFTRFIFSTIVTLFHELGHAVMGWLMGYPSIPAFDFVYGGGLTPHGEFRRSIAIAIAIVFAYFAWLFRENRKSLMIVGAIFLVWLFFVTREWRRETIFAAAGHGGELILAGIFFYKALSGTGWRAPEFERPLGAFVAFFVQINTTLFAWRLLHDAAFLDWYREGKGGALMHDLEVIALNLQIWTGASPGIEGAARGLLVFSMLPTVVALVWYFERSRWHRVLRALRTAEG